MKLKGLSDQYAIFNHSSFGPVFGGGDNMLVQGSNVHFFSGNTYHPGSLPHGQYTIKEIEVFQIKWIVALSKNRYIKRKTIQAYHTGRQARHQVYR